MATLIGIDAATLVFVVAGILVLWPMDPDQTRRSARSEDLRPAADEIAVVIGLVASLAGLVALQIMGGQRADNVSALLALLGVFLTWGALHVLYAVRYAYMYYDEQTPGGIDFNTDAPPCYRDFFYVSFAIGMTYGVTDSSVSTTALCSVVLRQSLLSFVFGTVILATAINVVTGALAG